MPPSRHSAAAAAAGSAGGREGGKGGDAEGPKEKAGEDQEGREPRGKALTFLLPCQPRFHTLLSTLSSQGMAGSWESPLEEWGRA